MKDISKEMDTFGMENRVWQFREDLPGDVIQSAKLVLAAFEKQWDKVTSLLASGADPRICRRGDAFGVESALYFALADKQWNIACMLYDAGDRLDDLVTEDESPLPWQTLDFLAYEMHCGRNYFLDESRSFSECCRCSAFQRIQKLMPDASQEELDKSILLTVFAWRRHFNDTDVYVEILQGIKRHGGKLSEEDKAEALDFFEKIKKFPAAMRPGKEDLKTISDYIRNW